MQTIADALKINVLNTKQTITGTTPCPEKNLQSSVNN